jgi:prepilin-type N-terminal cleavage/methylation domain-containing protein/prepilin-type processing-associated H-X9-DG protein
MHLDVRPFSLRRATRAVRSRRGFSLTELLVSIGILAILLGVLLPALGGVRQSSRVSACLGNLRQLAQAHSAYMVAHDGAFIDAGLSHEAGGGDGNDDVAWVNQLRPYYGGRSYDGETAAEEAARAEESIPVTRSPLDTSPHWSRSQGGAGVPAAGDRFRRTSYAFNDFLSRRYSPYVAIEGAFAANDRLGRVPSPADTVLFVVLSFAGDYAVSDHVHVADLYNPVDPLLLPTLARRQIQIDAAGGPESDYASRSNYAYLDGSVGTAAFGEVFLPPADRNGDGVVAGAGDFVNRFDPRAAARFTSVAQLADGQ